MKRPSASLVVIVALFGTALLGGCSGVPRKSPSGPTSVKVGGAENNTTIALAQGQELVVTLPANPSTGFTWDIASMPANIATQGAPVFISGAQETTPALVGAGGEVVFTFLCTGSTSGVLELAYHRPWEKKPAARTYRLTINAP